MAMEFWGVEVKSGESMKVKSGGSFGLHLSQASLGEFQKEKGNESVCLYVTIGDQKFVLGTLSPQKFPQLSFDLVFNEDFELSHNWKSGIVYFLGYRGPNGSDNSSEDEDESEEDFPITAHNGKPKSEAKQTKPIADTLKPDSTVTKQKMKIVEASKDVKFDEENDDSIDEEDDSLSDDQAMSDDVDEDDDDDEDKHDDGSDEEEDESDDEDKEMQKKAEIGKKRTADSAMKAPFSYKKARLVTPEKTDGKKVVVHVATPHPAKQAVKISGNSSQSKGQSPKSFACKFCSRSFGSENAWQSHTKAKHSAAQ